LFAARCALFNFTPRAENYFFNFVPRAALYFIMCRAPRTARRTPPHFIEFCARLLSTTMYNEKCFQIKVM